MGKYYYVSMAWFFDDNMYLEVDDLITLRRLDFSSEPNTFATHIKNVLKRNKKVEKKKNIFGKSIIEDVCSLEPFPIICELTKDNEGKDILIDIITNESFLSVGNNKYDRLKHSHDLVEPTERPQFYIVAEVSPKEVRQQFNLLDDEAIDRYILGMKNFLFAAKRGYSNYIDFKEREEYRRNQEECEIEEYRKYFARRRSKNN